jgi:hypothetical protein
LSEPELSGARHRDDEDAPRPLLATFIFSFCVAWRRKSPQRLRMIVGNPVRVAMESKFWTGSFAPAFNHGSTMSWPFIPP